MAVQEAPQLVSAPERSIIFFSRRSELRLVKVPVHDLYGPQGQNRGQSKGQTLVFRDGQFRAPIDAPLQLDNGELVEPADLVEFLSSHRLLGDKEEGFWRVDPTAPAPSEAELDALMEAATTGNSSRLALIIEQERAGWGREKIIDVAQKGIERIERIRAEQSKPKPKPTE